MEHGKCLVNNTKPQIPSREIYDLEAQFIQTSNRIHFYRHVSITAVHCLFRYTCGCICVEHWKWLVPKTKTQHPKKEIYDLEAQFIPTGDRIHFYRHVSIIPVHCSFCYTCGCISVEVLEVACSSNKDTKPVKKELVCWKHNLFKLVTE